MTPIQVTPDIGQNPWRDLDVDASGMVTRIGLLRNGTKLGKASVALVITTDDGQQIVGQTTWATLRMAYLALAGSAVAAEEVIDP